MSSTTIAKKKENSEDFISYYSPQVSQRTAPDWRVGIHFRESHNFCNGTLTNFSYRGLTLHKLTPMPDAHKAIQPTS